jgi:hypothetical protein
MNKAKIMPQLLMDNAAAYYANLKNTGQWKTEISKNTQIIVLTMQITELKTKVSKVLIVRAPTGQSAPSSVGTGTNGGTGTNPVYTFELWHLKKINKKAKHSMIEWDGKTDLVLV